MPPWYCILLCSGMWIRWHCGRHHCGRHQALSHNIKLKDSYTWTRIESWIHLRNFCHTEEQTTESNCIKRVGRTVLFCLLLLSCFSHVRLCATPRTPAHQASPSMGFSRQEHWSGLPFPPPFVLPTSSNSSGWYCSAPGRHFSDWVSLT